MSGGRSELGLREQKKRATRTALSDAALELALERGLDAVVVADIAAKANVSTRTFSNYFSNKEQAIVAAGGDRLDRFRAAIRARPPGEALGQALDRAIDDLFPADERLDRNWIAQVQLIKASAALAAEQRNADAAGSRALAEVIASRTGTDVDRDLYPQLVAQVVITTVGVALDHWIESEDGGVSLASNVRKALSTIAPIFEPRSAT